MCQTIIIQTIDPITWLFVRLNPFPIHVSSWDPDWFCLPGSTLVFRSAFPIYSVLFGQTGESNWLPTPDPKQFSLRSGTLEAHSGGQPEIRTFAPRSHAPIPALPRFSYRLSASRPLLVSATLFSESSAKPSIDPLLHAAIGAANALKGYHDHRLPILLGNPDNLALPPSRLRSRVAPDAVGFDTFDRPCHLCSTRLSTQREFG